MHELRCPSRLHGIVVTPGDAIVEFKCRSRFCGSAPGTAVLHRFDTSTGTLTATLSFKDPVHQKE